MGKPMMSWGKHGKNMEKPWEKQKKRNHGCLRR
jgi:hypothetical protein